VTPFLCCTADRCAGLERDKFDNKTVTFEEHIKEEHNMWHYLFFVVLVKVKDSTEYTGPESYVAEMIRVRMAGTCSFYFGRFGHHTSDLIGFCFGDQATDMAMTHDYIFRLISD